MTKAKCLFYNGNNTFNIVYVCLDSKKIKNSFLDEYGVKITNKFKYLKIFI